MKEKPILMSAPMVRAILAGRKTQTRRIIKPQPQTAHMISDRMASLCYPGMLHRESPYGGPGDKLWVRETFKHIGNATIYHEVQAQIMYRSDNVVLNRGAWPDFNSAPKQSWWNKEPAKWKPSIYMPRWASRITLEVTQVRVQRLQEISEDDAKEEGVYPAGEPCSCRMAYSSLWESINGKDSWLKNPFVWAITFKRV